MKKKNEDHSSAPSARVYLQYFSQRRKERQGRQGKRREEKEGKSLPLLFFLPLRPLRPPRLCERNYRKNRAAGADDRKEGK